MPFSLAALLLICAALMCACNRAETSISLESCYDIYAVFSDDMRSADIYEEILYTNVSPDRLDSVKLHLYPNAFSEAAVNNYLASRSEKQSYKEAKASSDSELRRSEKASMDGYLASMKKGDFGKIEVLSAEINGKTSDFAVGGIDDTILTVPCAIEPGQTVNIAIEAKLTVPVCDERLGVTDKTVNLSCIYPSLCVYENGAWRTEPYYRLGDPFYSEIASFYLTVEVPDGYTVAAGGDVKLASSINGKNKYEITAEKIRDFSMCASKNFLFETTDADIAGGSVKVNYFYVDDDYPDVSLRLAADVLEAFSEAFGAYPYPEFTLAQSPLNAGGMEYGAFVIIAPSASRAQVEETIIHETAHQWWYGAVGSDQISNAWLDEGLAEFCTGYYYRLKGDGERFSKFTANLNAGLNAYASLTENGKTRPMSMRLDAFESEEEYVALTYFKGALMFDALFSLMGGDKFNSALSIYFNENKFKTVMPSVLIDCFTRTGVAVEPIFRSFLDGKVR